MRRRIEKGCPNGDLIVAHSPSGRRKEICFYDSTNTHSAVPDEGEAGYSY